MSGPHRKVSRSLDNSSGFVTSRSHLTQPENELKQKLNAIDSSIKISNKKINKETHELRQILYDLQRDLKVSKSVSHYVPSPIEEQETKQTKRVRRVTVATAPGDLQLQRAEIFPKNVAEGKTTAEDVPGVTQGNSTKRRRKTSVPPTTRGKILVKDDDIFQEKKRELANTLSKEKASGVEESEKESLKTNEMQDTIVKMSCEEGKINKCEHTTDGNRGHCDNDGVQDGAQMQTSSARDPGSGEPSEGKPSSLSLGSSMSSDQLDSSNIDNKTTNISSSNQGIPTIGHAKEEWSSTHEITKGNSTNGNVTSYSKYLKEGRRRSLSESETAYRETFKGRFVTHSLPPQSDHVRGILPPPDLEKRSRRITVAGPPPTLGTRHRLNIGDIPVTPFNSGSRRISVNSMHEDERSKSRSLGRGNNGGRLPLRRGSDNEGTDKNLLTTQSRDTQRYRR